MSGWITSCTALLVLGGAFGLLRAGRDDARADSGWARRAEMVPITAGTVIGDQPPRTWSHLVIKSIPRLASGDLETLPRTAFRTATLFRTVILADVGRSADDSRRFVLRKIGIGLCVPDPPLGDVVVHSSRLEELGVRLGMVDKIVLRSAEAELGKGRLIASRPTFALYRGPTMMQVGQVHQKFELSYALLVDEHTGALRVLVWSQKASKDGLAAPDKLVELTPNLVFDCRLNVKAEKLLCKVPVSWSFAMESLPPGKPVTLSADLARYLERDTQPNDPETMEQALRRALTGRQAQPERTSGGS
jgi:hypothetical protein